MANRSGVRLLGVLLGVCACNCEGDPPPVDAGPSDVAMDRSVDVGDDAGPDSYDPFAVWREMRAAVRQSPDHLPARAEDLVAAADLAGLLALVQDDVATLPPTSASLVGMASTVRWGTRATLRGGAGTPREKAELLAELYRRAGVDAEVVLGALDPSIEVPSLFLREVAPLLGGITREQVDGWRARLGQTADVTPLELAPESEVTALADRVEAAVVAPGAPFDFALTENVPIVRVTLGDGSAMHANPIVPGAPFGDSRTVGELLPAGATDAQHTVRIALEASYARTPFERTTLVENTWSADEVAGRRIAAAFAPVIPNATARSVGAEAVQVVVPVLTVTGDDVTPDMRDALSVTGDPLTRTGERFQIVDGEVSLDGVSLGRGESDPAALARVASVAVRSDSSRFPIIDVHLEAADAEGSSVVGLGADAFDAFDEDAQVGFVLLQNESPPPKVLLLFDNSDSVPTDYRGPGAVALGNDIATRVASLVPGASFRVGTVFFGITYQGPWTGDLAELNAQLGDISGTGSALYSAAADAMDAEPTVVVLVSDGEPDEELTPELEAAIAGQAPIVMVRVGGTDPGPAAELARISDGLVISPSSPSEAAAAIEMFVRARHQESYRLRYRAPSDIPEMRNARVSVDARVDGTAPYRVPAAPIVANRISSVWLTITSDGRTSSRLLGGFDQPEVIPPPPVPAAAMDEADDAMLSSTIVMVEGAAPTTSVWLDERLSGLISLEGLYRGIVAEDPDEMERGYRAGSVTPQRLVELNSRAARRASDAHLVFETGLRITSFTDRPAREVVGRYQATDVFPQTLFATAASDGALARRRTLERTAALMVTESRLFPNSTLSALAGASFRAIDPARLDDDLADVTEATRARWRQVLAPFGEHTALARADADPSAFFIVHPGGTLVGLLRDGGGESNVYEEDRRMIRNVFGGASAAGLITPGLEAWASLEQTKLTLLSYATEVIDGGLVDPSEFFALAFCGAVRDAFSPIPGASEYFDLRDAMDLGFDLGGELGGGDTPSSPLPCL